MDKDEANKDDISMNSKDEAIQISQVFREKQSQ